MKRRFDDIEIEPLKWLVAAIVCAFGLGAILYVTQAHAAAEDYGQHAIRAKCEPPPGVRRLIHREDLEELLAATFKLHKELEEAEGRCGAPKPEPKPPAAPQRAPALPLRDPGLKSVKVVKT